MRPDGYLASALSGRPLQRMGPVALRDGRLMAGPFEVGAFYLDKGGVFFPLEDSASLQQARGLPLGELGLEHDALNAALDGAEDALAEMVLALGHLVLHPIRSLEDLAQLPSAVAALLASSPGLASTQVLWLLSGTALSRTDLWPYRRPRFLYWHG
ncbi:uncharacterized protein STAUR_3680 [Stigmatella aurantiaca DW4/3-1]|uniref:Uncharacterized protein n=1 Tax=Stigmatella aurantiaca (strain DW4/3-1) TaxID=378806 RepID=Q098B8_STIAD|nr:uncharacterized protein STAUR_3680 [Stigmatella aurantiaca DW4/3-1]EAU68059.1 hypothetical protein STIAU_5085 [Stigmatella aurantiaca DW4/3-1]